VPSTIFTAPEYNPERERHRRFVVLAVAVAAFLLGVLGYLYRNWPEEHVAERFFTALSQENYEQAYAIWQHDPAWKQHPEKYSNYRYGDFYGDWGPGGEWGLVKTFHIDGSASPSGGSGVVVVVTINGRNQKARVWVEKKDKTMTFSPY